MPSADAPAPPADPRIELGHAAGRALSSAPSMDDQAFPGDTVTFTAGEEHYALEEGNVVVGPIAVATQVGPGERAVDAFARAQVMAQTMFEVEFKQKVVGFKKRAAEARKL